MKHLNRNSTAHPHPQLRCSLYHSAHWIAACPPDKSPESVSDTLSPGLLGNLANCTNQLPVKLTLHRHRTFPQDSSMEINSHRNITLRSKRTLIAKRQLWQQTKEAIWGEEEEDEGTVSFTGHTVLLQHWSVDPSITSCLLYPNHHYIFWAPVVWMGVG